MLIFHYASHDDDHDAIVCWAIHGKNVEPLEVPCFIYLRLHPSKDLPQLYYQETAYQHVSIPTNSTFLLEPRTA